MEYKNNREVSLMIWEENPNKRNKNNTINVNVKKPNVLEVGDEIVVGISSGSNSVYQITEIVSSRQSALSDYNYVQAKTNWYAR